MLKPSGLGRSSASGVSYARTELQVSIKGDSEFQAEDS